jgi:hypothetical protein
MFCVLLFLYKFLLLFLYKFFGLFWVSAFERTYVRSTAPMRIAFDLTVVSSTVAHPAHAHTIARWHSNLPCEFECRACCTTCARHECDRTHSYAFERTRAGPFQDLFLGHFFPIFPIFPFRPYTPLQPLLRPPPRKHPNPSHPPPPTTNPPSPSHRRPLSGHYHPPLATIAPISSFSPQKTRKPISPIFFNFFSFFLVVLGTNPFLDCDPLVFCVLGVFLQGVRLNFSWVLQPFEFGLTTKCSTKFPKEPTACLEGKVHRPGHRGPALQQPGHLWRAGSSCWRTLLLSKKCSPTMKPQVGLLKN